MLDGDGGRCSCCGIRRADHRLDVFRRLLVGMMRGGLVLCAYSGATSAVPRSNPFGFWDHLNEV